MSNRRRGMSPSRPMLHMDRLPAVKNIADPSNPAGKRKEIDNVMKKARNASTNEYWDKKLIEVEEKDPNRWRHSGYKKMYIEGDSSSESEREGNFRYNNNNINNKNNGNNNFHGGSYRSRTISRSRSRSRIRKTPPLSPRENLRRSPPMQDGRHHNMRRQMSPMQMGSRRMQGRAPDIGNHPIRGRPRPRSPPEPPMDSRSINDRRKSPPMRRTPVKSPLPPRRIGNSGLPQNKRAPILPRSKRPPSPPAAKARNCPSRSNSTISSCSDDSCSVCSPKHRSIRSRSTSLLRSHAGPRSPPTKSHHGQSRGYPMPAKSRHLSHNSGLGIASTSRRPVTPPPPIRPEKYRSSIDKGHHRVQSRDVIMERAPPPDMRSSRHSPIDPRLKNRPPEPPLPIQTKKKKDKTAEKLRTKIKIEGEKRSKKQHNSSSDSEESESSEGSLPTFTAITRLTLSERFGKMAQWSIDRSNMENMRITKDSAGGALKVMIEEGAEKASPPRRFSYSPAPVGHFPEELAVTAPSGMLSWDDVRVRFEYYRNRGYLRDLDLKDYIKWEEWWYRYQEWLKQERYYEFWERQHMHPHPHRGGGMIGRGRGRGGKKIPIQNRLN